MTVELETPPQWPAARTPTHHRLVFHGRGGSLFGIHIVNVFLTLLTFGVYYFWGKARVRRYLFAQTELDGDRFAFHGHGREMLLGFIKASIVFGLPLTALNWVPQLLHAGTGTKVATTVAAYALVTVLIPVARVGARRYRLSRTSWRGIRFSFRGRTAEFVRIYAAGALLTALTLGLFYPAFTVRNHAFMMRHSYFGNARFDFDGRSNGFLVNFLYAVLLTLPTLGLVWFWFVATQRRYFWDHTTFPGARFRSTVTGGRLLRLKLGNLLFIALTLGLGWPWATTRTARFTCRYVTLEGALDLAAIQQQTQMATATGEGLLGLFEADLDLG
ncbi:MAG: YjgN family protein [Candidatus Rokuibacteriota bacterium]